MSDITPTKPSTTASRPRSGSATGAKFNEKELALLADLALIEKESPKVYSEFMQEKKDELRHLRRLAWADLIAQVIGNVFGLTALVVLAVIAWHAIDRNAASQGAAIICTGAVSIVAVFVTGRVTGSRRAQTALNQKPSS